MTARERCVKAMRFEVTDRLPIMMNGLPWRYVCEITGIGESEYWQDQLAAHAAAFRIIGVDFCEQLAFPRRDQTEKPWSSGEVDRWKDPDAVAADLAEQTAAIGRRADALEGSLEPHTREIFDYQLETQRKLGPDCLWLFGMDAHGPAILHFPYGRYGYEGFSLAVALTPDIMEAYWRAESRWARLHNRCVLRAAELLDWPRIGYLGTDMTTQTGNMISPAAMDRLYFPHLESALAPLVDAGFTLVWHSDGNMNDMLRPLIAIGIAGFQGFQEECGTRIVDVAKLRNRKGDPLVLWGSVSSIDVVRRGSFADIEAEVRRVLAEWPHPGLCLATASAMMDDTPHRNISELYRLFRELGACERRSRPAGRATRDAGEDALASRETRRDRPA